MNTLISSRTWVSAAAAAAMLVALPGAVVAQSDFRVFVLFDGVPGSSTEPVYAGWSEAVSYSQGFQSLPAVQEVRVLKEVDDASPALRLRVATGQLFPTVLIRVAPGNDLAAPFIRVELTSVEVTQVTEAGSGPNGRPRELVSLAFVSGTMTTSAPPAP